MKETINQKITLSARFISLAKGEEINTKEAFRKAFDNYSKAIDHVKAGFGLAQDKAHTHDSVVKLAKNLVLASINQSWVVIDAISNHRDFFEDDTDFVSKAKDVQTNLKYLREEKFDLKKYIDIIENDDEADLVLANLVALASAIVDIEIVADEKNPDALDKSWNALTKVLDDRGIDINAKKAFNSMLIIAKNTPLGDTRKARLEKVLDFYNNNKDSDLPKDHVAILAEELGIEEAASDGDEGLIEEMNKLYLANKPQDHDYQDLYEVLTVDALRFNKAYLEGDKKSGEYYIKMLVNLQENADVFSLLSDFHFNHHSAEDATESLNGLAAFTINHFDVEHL